ncbi:hypothetical protein AVEN_254910-1 [Araneus ventricosus]|uniref:Uncharacterized protein n=1 Tax=Araneus ventricosus TaxID=182803 RepID=A0A4Y2RP92_ARAVE|nr:hypothetical protein AVEN_254910-1 [Araneus ventricosus]
MTRTIPEIAPCSPNFKRVDHLTRYTYVVTFPLSVSHLPIKYAGIKLGKRHSHQRWLPERALLVKLFYENKGNAAAALREFRRLKNLRKVTLLPQALRRMIARFEKTGHLGVQRGRGRKSTRSDVVEDVATAIVEQSMDNVVGCSSARAVSRHLSLQYSAERTQKNGAFFPVQD